MRYVRKLEKAVWWDIVPGQVEGELSADAFRNAATEGGELSIYAVSDEKDLELVLAALAYRRNALRDTDYCLFDGSVLERAGVETKKTKGATGCAAVDECHLDIIALTVESLSAFVCRAAFDGELESVDKRKVKSFIELYAGTGELPIEKINVDLRKALAL